MAAREPSLLVTGAAGFIGSRFVASCNARGVGGRYRIGHGVMTDALDADGIWDAIRNAGLELPDRPHHTDLGGRLVNVFLKCEVSQDGSVHGRRVASSRIVGPDARSRTRSGPLTLITPGAG